MDSQQAEEGGRQKPTPPSTPTVLVAPSASQSAAWARAQEPGPTVKSALHAGQGLARRLLRADPGPKEQQTFPALPTTCGWSWNGSAFGSGLGGAPLLQTQRLCIRQPTLQHVAARPGFVDKVWNGFSVSVSFYTKGTNCSFTLCTNAASAFAISIFNLLVPRELLIQ